MKITKMKRGFVPVEVVIVVCIIVLLTAVAVPSYIQSKERRGRFDELALQGYEFDRNSGFWYTIDSKEVVDVSQDLWTVSEPIGRINCPISVFRRLAGKDKAREITFYKQEDSVKFSPSESQTDTITVNGTLYRKVK